MSLWSTLGDEGPAIRRGLITIFLAAGGITAWRWNQSQPLFQLLLGLGSVAVGAGIWLFWRWARWLALGACFLAILAAFSTPMLLAMWKPFEQFSSEPRMTEAFTCIFAGAFGVIGYKGLSHLRSADARVAFEAEGESSLHVLISALCVAILLAGVFASRDVKLPKLSATVPPQALPDLVVKRLCMSGTTRVEAEIANQGAASYPGEFTLGFDDLQYARYSEYVKGEVPAPGRSTYISLTNAYNSTRRDGHRLAVRMFLDSSTIIPESNEDNNRSDFELVFDANQVVNLPSCDSAGGEVERPAQPPVAGSAALPDLVIDALCMSPFNLVKAEVRNQGTGSYPGKFSIAYDDLRNARASEYSQGDVPPPGKTTYVELNTASNPTEQDGYSIIVRTSLDTRNQVPESDESNNQGAFELAFNQHYPTNLPRCP